MLHDEAPETECEAIHLFLYGGFHLSVCQMKF